MLLAVSEMERTGFQNVGDGWEIQVVVLWKEDGVGGVEVMVKEELCKNGE